MTTVVTGASGHVGANLVRMLLERGEPVRAVVRRSTAALDGLPIERVEADVCDPASLLRAFEGARRVLHLASLISISGDRDGRVFATNVVGARNVARAARAAGVERLVHVSSIHAFRQDPLHEPIDETRARVDGPGHPAYDRSKAAGEAEVRAEIEAGLDAVIVNPSAIIGPHDYGPSRMGRFIQQIATRKLPALVPGGFDWVDVRDVCAGILAAAERGRRGENYLLSGQWRPVTHVARLVAELAGVPVPPTVPRWAAQLGAPFIELWGHARGREPLYTRESLAALAANRSIRNDKARRELGYDPRAPEAAFEAAYRWFVDHGAIPARRPGLPATGTG